MTNKLIDRSVPVDVGGVVVAVRLLSMRESMRLKAAWQRYLAKQDDEQLLGECIGLAIESHTADEVLETFTQTEVYQLIGRSFEESALTGIERKKSQSSPQESAASYAASAEATNASTTSDQTTT